MGTPLLPAALPPALSPSQPCFSLGALLRCSGGVWQGQGGTLFSFWGGDPPDQHQEAKHPSSLSAGIDKFKGRYLHSRDYKDAQDFTDKRVVVIGIGNSGSDLAVEISHTAKQVSSRSRVLVGRAAPRGTLPAPRGHQGQGAGTATTPSRHSLHSAVPAPSNPSCQVAVAAGTPSHTDTSVSIPEPGVAPVALPYLSLPGAHSWLSLPSGSSPSTWAV